MLYDPRWEEKIVTMPLEGWQIVLLKAADIVRRRGLAKYTQRAGDGSVCVQGAISVAVTGQVYCSSRNEKYCEATRRLGQYLIAKGEEGADETGNAYWNNAPERTAEEVIAALEGCAALVIS